MIRNNLPYYYHADGLGSIIAITDSSGNVVQRYEYNSFGEITYQQDPNFVQPYTYTGREYDQESGLYYYRARYYDAKIGRFLQQDPLWGYLTNPQSLNRYPYVDNSPLNWIDPWGLEKTITIEENCSCPSYGASVTVTDTDTNKTLFSGRGSTLPNNPGQQNSVAPGTYSGTNTTRASGGSGIYIGNTPTAPGSPRPTAYDIFIHCGYSATNRGSAGCLTIQPDQCAEFFKQFGKEEPVTVNIRR